jgi:hypothetical protein
MPRQWRALPFPPRPDLLLKAPSYQEFLDQEFDGEHFRLKRLPAGEVATAEHLLRTLVAIEKMAQAQEFTVYRFAAGVGVKTPSGWVAMMHYPKVASEVAAPEAKPARKPARRKAAGATPPAEDAS